MFSGEGLPPFTWRNFKEMFLTHGIKVTGEEYENGLASIEARWRPPIPHVPTVLYVEWGADDNHSAWFKFPALVAGIAVPSARQSLRCPWAWSGRRSRARAPAATVAHVSTTRRGTATTSSWTGGRWTAVSSATR